MNSIIKNETAIVKFGLTLRAHNVVANDSGRILNQKIGVSKSIANGRQISVYLRFDDEYGNGRESFSITGEIVNTLAKRGDRHEVSGCIHDEIAKHFPELAHLIKWHLTSTDGPMHYVGNTTYHASNRDHNGLLKDEKRQIRNGKTGQLCWILEQVGGEENKAPNTIDSDTQPAAPQFSYIPWCRTGEGKERELDAARWCAVWPDATDEQLSLPKEELTVLLESRLPQLLADFKADMLRCGFLWPEHTESKE